MGAWLKTEPPEICPSPTSYPAKCGHSRSNGISVITEIRQKNFLPLTSRLSVSFKVTGTETDQSATYDFLLAFHVGLSQNEMN